MQYLLPRDVHEVQRVGRHLARAAVERLRQHFESESGRHPVHALGDTGFVTVFLFGPSAWIDVFEIFPSYARIFR